MSIGRLSFLLILLLLQPFSSAWACRGPVLPFKDRLAQASTVFVGRIIAVTPLERSNPRGVGNLVQIEFSVERWWKGHVDKAVMVLGSTDSCGFARGGRLSIGEKWLILATGESELTTSALSGNVWLESKENHPTDQKIPELLFRELGEGKVP